MGLWSVSMLVAAELLRVLRLSPSTVVALAQGLAVQVDFLALVTPQLGPADRRVKFSTLSRPRHGGGTFFISPN